MYGGLNKVQQKKNLEHFLQFMYKVFIWNKLIHSSLQLLINWKTLQTQPNFQASDII